MFASVMRSAAARRPGTATSSATTSAKNTARPMALLRSERFCTAIAPRCSSSVASARGWACCTAMPCILTRRLAESGGCEAVAMAEGAGGMRGLAGAHEARHVGNRDRRLLDPQRRGGRHAPSEQVLVEAQIAELLIRPLQ